MSGLNYGLDAELKAKQDAKADEGLEAEVVEWIEGVVGEKKGDHDFAAWLKDGQVLCTLANTIKPGSIKQINKQSLPFKQMENITNFMNAARAIGVPENSMFGTPDLYEEKNIPSVVNCLYTFAGVIQVKVPEYSGPKLGAPINVENKDGKRASVKAVNQATGIAGSLDKQGIHTAARTLGTDLGPDAQADAQGLDADLKAKQAAKFDVGLESEVCEWIESITGQKKEGSTHEWLKDGLVLCDLVNKIKPDSIKKPNSSKLPFKQMENITFFMKVAREWGVPESSMFGTPDLYEEKNMGSVVACMYAFGGAVQVAVPGFSGAKLGTAMKVEAKTAKRNSNLCTNQYEAMQNTMEVSRPRDGGITRGA